MKFLSMSSSSSMKARRRGRAKVFRFRDIFPPTDLLWHVNHPRVAFSAWFCRGWAGFRYGGSLFRLFQDRHRLLKLSHINLSRWVKLDAGVQFSSRFLRFFCNPLHVPLAYIVCLLLFLLERSCANVFIMQLSFFLFLLFFAINCLPIAIGVYFLKGDQLFIARALSSHHRADLRYRAIVSIFACINRLN